MQLCIAKTRKSFCAIKCFQEYQKCFQRTKQRLEESPNERKFDFSEMYIFGKFVAFERRLRKILDMFETIRVYSALERSKIEGLEPMVGKYQVIHCFISTKLSNFLWAICSLGLSDFNYFQRFMIPSFGREQNSDLGDKSICGDTAAIMLFCARDTSCS